MVGDLLTSCPPFDLLPRGGGAQRPRDAVGKFRGKVDCRLCPGHAQRNPRRLWELWRKANAGSNTTKRSRDAVPDESIWFTAASPVTYGSSNLQRLMIERLRCLLRLRHDYQPQRAPGRVFLECTHCGQRSSGWKISRARPPQTRDEFRLLLDDVEIFPPANATQTHARPRTSSRSDSFRLHLDV